MKKNIATRLRAAVVDAVDTLVPKPLLRLVIHPKVLAVIGPDRIDKVGCWIDNTFMLKRRQKRCEIQPIEDDTRAYLKTRFCGNPFRQIETAQTGLAYVCCPVWLPTPIGTLDTPPEALWDSPAARDIRASIVDGSFKYCNHLNCQSIASRTLPSRDAPESRAIIQQFETSTLPKLPEHLILSHDKSCNLSCPSCRSSVYVANRGKQAQLDSLTEKTLVPLMKDAKSVMITGSGDPFGSKHFRNLIKRLNGGDFPDLKMDLISNGQLWDQRAWVELKLGDRVRYAQISVDATTPETYAFVRRGGTFERLRKNLAFIRDLRQSGQIQELEFSMVVQSRNFREMPDFVRLGDEFAADLVTFNMIRQRDIFSKDEFVDAFIGDPDHLDYAAFLAVLQDPILKRPNVQIGNILGYVRQAEERAVA